MSILDRFLGDANARNLKKIQPLVERINQLESDFQPFSDERLKQKTQEFKDRLAKGESLDYLLPEAFACVREAAKRTIGQRHFDVQLIAGVALHQGKIAEMKTGEGKTLAATLAVYLNALAGQGAHVVTVNDYLSRRDTNWMGPIYHLLGLSCACLNHEKSYLFAPRTVDKDVVTVEMANLREVPRQEAYAADITYGTNNEFGFDYLRDNMAPSLDLMAQRKHYFAIVDEVDSILIDEARTPLIISIPDTQSAVLYQQFAKLVPSLKENEDYNVDEKMRAVTLTEAGIAKMEKLLGMENIYQEGGVRYVHHLEQALRAQVLFKRDRNYIVKPVSSAGGNNEVIIVDEFTGRLMPGRRYSDGLHQALEAKEGVRVQHESRTLASVTFQNYFRLYEKLAGMTGTAMTSAEEFSKVYGLEVIPVPTNKPMVRADLPDKVFRTEKGKFQAIVRQVKTCYDKGQPVLIGTVSIEKNELLSGYLKKEGVPHQILNAKNHEQEARIIAQAGRRSAVTVATNMAGRGVDIVLGEGVAACGGLFVLGTERHEARRIDDQLRGRAGRQGDPGSSQFYVSLEDDLMRVFGGDRVKAMMEMMKVPEDQPIENKLVSKAIESAQQRIEGFNFDTRKHVLEYDDVMNKQRGAIYKRRREILEKENLKENMLEMVRNEIKRIVEFHTQEQYQEKWNLKEIGESVKAIFMAPQEIVEELKKFNDPQQISDHLIKLAQAAYEGKEKELGGPADNPVDNQAGKHMRQVERFVLLRAMDALWMDHLDDMDHLRDSVRLRAYGQKDPLVEYKNEGVRLFHRLLDSIQSTAVNMIYKVSIRSEHDHEHDHKHSHESKTLEQKNIGRNDPCPCGSGKKYKKCHGA